MNTPSNAIPGSADSHEVTPPVTVATRPFYWSVRRELWEHRWIYIAPIVVSAVFLFAFLISTFSLPRRMRAGLTLDPGRQHSAVVMPYTAVTFFVLATAFIVGVYYCLEALHSERRDRAILFWKSLPVSDRTAVLAKAGIPLVVLPLFVFVLIVVAQVSMLLLSTVVLLGNGPAVWMLWSQVHIFQMWLVLLYAVIALALWHAPVYAWLLLVSAWARRAPFLWVVLPVLAISMFEWLAFRSSHFASLLGHRLVGPFAGELAYKAHHNVPPDPLASLAPAKLLTTPGLWIGLVVAALFLAAAIRLRRYREPI